MFICDRCGKQLEELKKVEEPIFLDGRRYTAFEFEIDDCKCGGTFKEAMKCPVCGEWFIEDTVDCCNNCFEENLTKETCISIGYNSLDINDFFRQVFSDEEINEILEREFDKIDNGLKKHYYREFAIQTDRLGQKIAERKKSENLHKR